MVVYCQKLNSLGYIFVADSMGLDSISLTHNNGHRSRRDFRTNRNESPYSTFYPAPLP